MMFPVPISPTILSLVKELVNCNDKVNSIVIINTNLMNITAKIYGKTTT